MSNVFTIDGEMMKPACEPAAEPPPAELIGTLETLLAAARTGHLRALAYATVREGGLCGVGWEGAPGTKFPLGAAVSILAARYPDWMIQET